MNSKTQEIYKWTVDRAFDGQRIDKFINSQTENWNRKKINDFILRGAVRLNKHTVIRQSEIIRKGDQVQLDTAANRDVIYGPPWQQNLRIRVIYFDDNMIVIEKPAGMLSVPNHPQNKENAVFYLRQFLQKKQKGKMPLVFYVHRLDKDTSGLLMFARHRDAQTKLKKLIADKSIKRKYLAIANGKMANNAGKLVDFITEKDKSSGFRHEITDEESGQKAITHYIVRKRLKGFTFVEFSLDTGRTHQIRLQMHHQGHPVMGDKKYKSPGDKNLFDISRLALHAFQLTVPNPYTGKVLKFEAPLPTPMADFIEKHT